MLLQYIFNPIEVVDENRIVMTWYLQEN